MPEVAMQCGDFEQKLRTYENAMAQLLKMIPRVRHLVVNRLKRDTDVPGFDAMKSRYESFCQLRQRGLQPPLVVTMFGPSGAGKSTLFRWLTGIDVPAGEDIRPMTYHSVVAVPESFSKPDVLQLVFPNRRVVPLRNPEEVAQKTQGDGRIFFAPMKSRANSLPFILADVPDFNTVECANWEQARQMLSRAELTIFLTYPESYLDKCTVETLAWCCQLSSRLVYVLTKISDQNPAEIWQDLLKKTGDQKVFGETRRDGRTLHEFLKGSLCYYSPRLTGEGDSLRIEPLEANQPSFLDLIRGQPAGELILAGLVESIYVAILAGEELLKLGHLYIEQISNNLEAARTMLDELVKKVVNEIYPLQDLMKFIGELAREKTSGVVRGVLRSMNRAVGKLVTPQAIKDSTEAVAEVIREQGKPLVELEKEKFRGGVKEYVQRIRGEFSQSLPEQSFGDSNSGQRLFSTEQTHELIRCVLDRPWPRPSSDWQEAVRTDVEKFLEENPAFARWMATLDDAVWTVGTGLFVVDLLTTGGLFWTIGALTLAGVGGSALAHTVRETLLKKLDEIGRKAHEAWVAQRSNELQAFLEEHFFKALFKPWLEDVRTVALDEIKRSLQACEQLKQLVNATQ